MAERKTHQTDASVKQFLAGVTNERRRKDSEAVIKIMKRISGMQPKMWGPSIIGFDSHQYTLASGKDAEICKIGFSPRSQALAFYLGNYEGRAEALGQLGKYKQGNGGCMYINKLEDVDIGVLEEIIDGAFNDGKSSGCN